MSTKQAQPKNAGPFATWLKQLLDAVAKPATGMDVPCGDCTACCQSSLFIHIADDEPAREAIPHVLQFPAPGKSKTWVMGYNEHGRCPMLKVTGENATCTVYNARPNTCRTFDCRVFTATEIYPSEPSQQAMANRAQQWQFEYPQALDRTLQAAVLAAKQFVLEQPALRAHLPTHPSQLAVAIIQLHELFLQPPAEDELLARVKSHLLA